MNSTPLQEFYKGKSIFVTGGSGFLGQILIEKLLRSFDVKEIFVLIRCKKGKTWQERIEDMVKDPLFNILKQQKPMAIRKIKGIFGDCASGKLGLTEPDRTLLQERVQIVFHAAATVRFDEYLSVAMQVNVLGTQRMIELCKEMKHLEALVYISTAYSNCNRMRIEEKIYEPPISRGHVHKILQTLNEETIDKVLKGILCGFPNTYVFTKCLSESAIVEQGKDLPIIVFRPAIVMPTQRDPVAGWTSNYYGPIGTIYGVAMGVLHVFYIDSKQKAQMVPVDLCVNALVATAWELAEQKKTSQVSPPIPVYNFVPKKTNIIDWNHFCRQLFEVGVKRPPINSVGHTTFTMTKNYYYAKFLHYLYHILPATFIDLILLSVGQKFRMKKVYEKIEKLNELLVYFTFNTFDFVDENVTNLWQKLDDRDKQLFPFDMSKVDWNPYLKDMYLGLRKYVMKNDPKNVPAARRRQQKIKVAHYCLTNLIKGLLLFVLFEFLCSTFQQFL